MDLCYECGSPSDLYWKRDEGLVPWCMRCKMRDYLNRLYRALEERVLACADCGTTRSPRWFRIIEGRWPCESCRGTRGFVTIVGWKPFGEPGDGTLFPGTRWLEIHKGDV
jgi:hypothetical protein